MPYCLFAVVVIYQYIDIVYTSNIFRLDCHALFAMIEGIDGMYVCIIFCLRGLLLSCWIVYLFLKMLKIVFGYSSLVDLRSWVIIWSASGSQAAPILDTRVLKAVGNFNFNFCRFSNPFYWEDWRPMWRKVCCLRKKQRSSLDWARCKELCKYTCCWLKL